MPDPLSSQTDTPQPLPRNEWSKSSRIKQLFSAFGHRNYRLFWSGNLVSLVGSWMQSTALSWLVYKMTGSEFLLGLIGFSNAIPLLILSPLGGVLVDRVRKQKLILATQFGMMTSAFLLAYLTWFGHIQIWQLFCITIFNGMLLAIDAPGRQSFIYELVGKEDLMNAIGMNSVAFNSARIIGPAIAGQLVGWFGEAGCFLGNGLSFLAVLFALMMMKLPPREPIIQKKSFADDIKQGFKYMAGHPTIRGLLTMVAVPSVLIMSYPTLMPVFAKEVFHKDAGGYGILMSSVGVGAVFGALLIGWLSRSNKKGRFLIMGAFGATIFTFLFAVCQWYWLACLLLVGMGFSNVVYLATTNALLQSNSPDEYRGRIISIFTLTSLGLTPFGNLLAGTIAEKTSAPITLGAFALITLSYTIFINYRVPQLRRLT